MSWTITRCVKVFMLIGIVALILCACGRSESTSKEKSSDNEIAKVTEPKNKEDKKKTEKKKTKNEKKNKNVEKSVASDVEEDANKQEMKPVEGKLSIDDGYKNAFFPPKKDPGSVWKGIDVRELQCKGGIHFYVPASWELYEEEDEDGVDSIYKNKDGKWVLFTEILIYSTDFPPGDWGESQTHVELGDNKNKHYYMCSIISDPYSKDDKYDPDIYFPELKDYRGKIEDTAWVEDSIFNQFMFYESDKKPIGGYLMGMPLEDLRIARNEIYARHGRKFKDKKLQAYFESTDWYEGTIEPEDWDDDVLSEIEKENIDAILEEEGLSPDGLTKNAVLDDEEAVIISKAEELGDIQGLTIEDYDGDGYKEAFCVRVEGKTFDGCRMIRGICFIDSKGNVREIDYGYDEDDDCYYYQDQEEKYLSVKGHGLFRGEFGGRGSGSLSFIFGVKNGEPYELLLSRHIEQFEKVDGKYVFLRAAKEPPNPENYANYKEEVELIFDAERGEFEIGDPTGRVFWGDEDVTKEYFSYF